MIPRWCHLNVLFLILALAGPADAKSVSARVREVNPSIPNPLKYLIAEPAGFGVSVRWYIFGIPLCITTATAIFTVRYGRPAKPSEAYPIIASCVIPVLGGMIVKRILSHYPNFDAMFPPPAGVDFGIGTQ